MAPAAAGEADVRPCSTNSSTSGAVVERCFNRLKQWRGIATRYEKTAESYRAAIILTSLLMWA
ncbi:transposase [Streptomyces flavidovirens]|uniref:transposase n=1 Tax=Streptomyces flavidovirens TaxID=67298 RepID=UPI003F56C631